MISINDITQEHLKECFDYERESGVLAWKKRPAEHFKTTAAMNTVNSRLAGKPAGSRVVTKNGKSYMYVLVCNQHIPVHRIIWFLVTGGWPKNEIDHIDGNGINNSWANLRDITRIINKQNTRLYSTNKSGASGVFWCKEKKKWYVSITVNRKRIYLGYYKSLEAAKVRRIAAELKYSFHPNHGKIRPL